MKEKRTVSKRKKVLGRCIIGPATSPHSTSEVRNIRRGTGASNLAT